MKEYKLLKKPPAVQIIWFNKIFNDETLKEFHLTQHVTDGCCGEEFIIYDSNDTQDLSSSFYMELFGGESMKAQQLLLMLSYSLYDALDIEYYEIANNIKIVIDEICSHPDTLEKYNKLPTERVFKNPNLK